MNNGSTLVEGLRNPLTGKPLGNLRIDAGFFRHVCRRHETQPLDDIFGEGNFARLCRRPDAALYAECGMHLAKMLRHGLERGLILAYDARDSRGHLSTTLLVILSCGAIAVLRIDSRVTLKSVYFLNRSLSRKSAEQRRSAAAGALVNRYAVWCGLMIVQPGACRTKRVRNNETGSVQVRTNICFFEPERWGFRLDLQGGPYRGRISA